MRIIVVENLEHKTIKMNFINVTHDDIIRILERIGTTTYVYETKLEIDQGLSLGKLSMQE